MKLTRSGAAEIDQHGARCGEAGVLHGDRCCRRDRQCRHAGRHLHELSMSIFMVAVIGKREVLRLSSSGPASGIGRAEGGGVDGKSANSMCKAANRWH